jgi:hypothetical protein
MNDVFKAEAEAGHRREKARQDRRAEALRRIEADLVRVEEAEAEAGADPVALPDGPLLSLVTEKPKPAKRVAKHK